MLELKKEKKLFDPIPDHVEVVGKLVVQAAFNVHSELGPGLLERVYEVCFCHELAAMGLSVQRQIEVPIAYKGLTFEEALRLDVLVEDSIICELKAVDLINPVWEAQLLSHLKLTNKRLGFLINFNVPNIGGGIKRFVK
jgi:GxxExxY protein